MLPPEEEGEFLLYYVKYVHEDAIENHISLPSLLKAYYILLQEDGSTRMIRRAETPEDYFATIEGFDF